MSFVTTHPAALTAAAGELERVGSAMAAQNAAGAASTTAVMPAAADEISALQATQFSAYGQLYQQISAQASAMHEMFVHTLRTSADTYGDTEAANTAAAAPSGGVLSGGGLAGSELANSGATGDLSYGVASTLSNSGIIAAMQAGNIGSATSEFTGLGKGYITAGSGVVHGINGMSISGIGNAGLVHDTAPAANTAAAAVVPVSAGIGQAPSVGGLSVPPSWAGEAPVPGAAPATLTGAGWTAGAPHTSPVTTMPAGLPAMASADRGSGFAGFGAPRYGVKPKVAPRRTVG